MRLVVRDGNTLDDNLLLVKCPLCAKLQRFILSDDDKTWYQIPPFCCNAMRELDTPEWNRLLDEIINRG